MGTLSMSQPAAELLTQTLTAAADAAENPQTRERCGAA